MVQRGAGYFVLGELLKKSVLTFKPVKAQEDVNSQSCMLPFTVVLYLAIFASGQPKQVPTSTLVFTVK